MIFEELLADIKEGKFLENLNDEKIGFLVNITFFKDYNGMSSAGGWGERRITRNQFIKLIYELEVFYINKEKELHEIYRKLSELGINFFQYEKMYYGPIDGFNVLSPLHFAIDSPVDPETDKKVLKRLITEMRRRKQTEFLDMTIESKKHTTSRCDYFASSDNRYLNVSPNHALMHCSIMDLAIVNNHWPAVEVLLEEGFNADQIIKTNESTSGNLQRKQPSGMPRLHFAYQLSTTEMFAKLVASPKLNINFRCPVIGQYITLGYSNYEGYGESILLDALVYMHNMRNWDKIKILVRSPNIDLTQKTAVSSTKPFYGNYKAKAGMTAIDIVTQENTLVQCQEVVDLIKEVIQKKMAERFNAVHEQLNQFQWDSGSEQHHFLPEMNKIVAQYDMLHPEELASTPIGQQTVRELTAMTFKFKDARQQGTWEAQNQVPELREEKQGNRI